MGATKQTPEGGETRRPFPSAGYSPEDLYHPEAIEVERLRVLIERSPEIEELLTNGADEEGHVTPETLDEVQQRLSDVSMEDWERLKREEARKNGGKTNGNGKKGLDEAA